VFATSAGRKDGRQNVRQRLFMKAIERANVRLAELGIEPLGDVRPHGLRRTFASLRAVCGDDPVYIARQIGHEDVNFTLNVYAQSVKRRERMTDAERKEYDRAIEWASWASQTAPLGTSAYSAGELAESGDVASYEKGPPLAGPSCDGRYWARTSDPQLVERARRSPRAATCGRFRLTESLSPRLRSRRSPPAATSPFQGLSNPFQRLSNLIRPARALATAWTAARSRHVTPRPWRDRRKSSPHLPQRSDRPSRPVRRCTE
jgi:hypothetical protein